jgi:hypothetical protein
MSTRPRIPTQRTTTAVKQSDWPLRNAIRRAAGSGWRMHPPESELTNDILVLHLAIDNNFWQALATTEQWSEWEARRQNFIEYLADGGNAASFFANILK